MPSNPETLLKQPHRIPIAKKEDLDWISIEGFERITGTCFISKLISDPKTFAKVARKYEKDARKKILTREQLWLGAYFKQEILTASFPDVFLRYIDPILGWGVFAARDFKKMEFIAEYSGRLRRRRRLDRKNAYCFEYRPYPGYLIDAMEQGGISRYINHSHAPNLMPALATIDKISHIIFYTKEPIAKGSQLCYDYGEDYWAGRCAPSIV